MNDYQRLVEKALKTVNEVTLWDLEEEIQKNWFNITRYS
jgi:uncharacterized protein (UPF0210 family)